MEGKSLHRSGIQLGRSTSKRYYFDYNATSPLAESVKSWLAKGDYPFGNPSSLHAEGKASRRLVQETKDYLLDFFGLPHYKIFFHSGATEGANAVITGYAKLEKRRKNTIEFFSVSTDHSCVHNLREELQENGHGIHLLPTDRQGSFNQANAISAISKKKNPTLLNFTWVNNETGVVWDLQQAVEIKEKTGCAIHVDGVQAVGKIKNFRQLSDTIDAYTFSAHKFGGMKGVGFTLLHPDFTFASCMRGGGQQEGMRSGTENVLSIYTIRLALQELQQLFDYDAMEEGKLSIENELKNLFSGKGEIVGGDAKKRNGNTIYFFVAGQNAGTMMTAFDLANIAVSSGSACSTGAMRPGRVMMAMGYTEDDARRGIRLSFPPLLNKTLAEEYLLMITKVVRRFL